VGVRFYSGLSPFLPGLGGDFTAGRHPRAHTVPGSLWVRLRRYLSSSAPHPVYGYVTMVRVSTRQSSADDDAAVAGRPAIIAIRVRPGASRTAVGGEYDGPYGRALVVTVTAPPVSGRASVAVLRELAVALGLKRRQLEMVTIGSSRDKRVRIFDPPGDLNDRITTLLTR
jgi:uncharacterized protein YggU (UPF0235/DUF167 family)